MLPSRDSGCKGTKFYPYQQISCLFLSFFIGTTALGCHSGKKSSDSVGCSYQLLVITHSLSCHQHEEEGYEWKAGCKLEVRGALYLRNRNDAEYHQKIVNIPESCKQRGDGTQVHLQLAVFVEKYRCQRNHCRYGEQKEQWQAGG